MATPTHESYAASKRILAWLSHRADLGVTYGASHLKSATDLLPPKDALLPMGDVRDFSLFCTVDSDLPGKGLPVRSLRTVGDTTFVESARSTGSPKSTPLTAAPSKVLRGSSTTWAHSARCRASDTDGMFYM
jgi:hypothetical protein